MMDSLQVVREDVPAEINGKLQKLFDGVWRPNFGLYGPKKYCIRDVHFKTVSGLIPHMSLRSDDVWIGGFLRSGTHWLAEMTWLINNNIDFVTARNVNHQDRVKIFELINIFEDDTLQPPTLKMYEKMPSQRFFKTHLPLSLLPSKVLETSKMIYVARDPRDAILSYYHLMCRWNLMKFNGSVQDAFDLFIKGYLDSCPYFENVLEYWNSQNHPNLLFLFYDDMVKDLPATVRRIAQFFDKNLSESQFHQLCEYLQFDTMKKSDTFNTEKFYKQDIQLLHKGKIGSWQEEFTEDMKIQAKKWMADNLKNTDLSFPS